MNRRQQIVSNYLKANQTLQDRLKNEQPGFIVFIGGTGTGKSTAIAFAIQKYRESFPASAVVRLVDGTEDANTNIPEGVLAIPINDSDGKIPSHVWRLDPDILALGEVRGSDTLNDCLEFVGTGHTVFASLHADSIEDAMDRIELMLATEPPDFLPDAEIEEWCSGQLEYWDSIKPRCLFVEMPSLATA